MSNRITRQRTAAAAALVQNLQMNRSSQLRQLPAEVLEQIFNDLSQRDLGNIAVVDRDMLIFARPLLYRSIALSSNRPCVQDTLALLASNRALAERVRSAVITTVIQQPQGFAEAGAPSWINPNIFQNLTRIESLLFIGFPFTRDIDILTFRKTGVHCNRLANIVFEPNAGMEFAGMNTMWDDTSMKLRLKLSPTHIFDSASITHIFDSASITHISLSGSVVHDPGNSLSSLLSADNRFFGLVSVELGSLAGCLNLPWSSQALTQFLNANPTIQHLSLGTQKPNPDISFQLHSPSLSAGFLPDLRSFEGFPENLTLMAQANVQSLNQLESLALVSTEEDLEDMRRMLEALTLQSFPSIKYLHVELYPPELNYHAPFNVTFLVPGGVMLGLGRLFPEVVSIYAKLPPINGGRLLGDYFRGFRSIERISLPHISLCVLLPPQQLFAYLQPISASCPDLQRLACRQPRGSQFSDDVYTLERDGSGALISISHA